jgi:ATP-dependent DNA ligase
MNLLTRPVGEKDRALLVHPKPAVERKGLKRVDGLLTIADPKAIKIKMPNILIPELKEAGHRHFLARDKKGNYSCFGRRLNVNKTYTDIYEKIKDMPHPWLPKETVIDFELVWPDHPDSEVVTAIKECPEELRMRCFAVPIYKGQSCVNSDIVDYIQGRNRLVRLVGTDLVTKKYKPISISKDTVIHVLEYLLNTAEFMGVEGFVLKAFHCKEWYKLKGINEADVFITGYKISKAETRMGMVTAVKVSVMDGEEIKDIGNVSGFNLEQMNEMTEYYNYYDAKGNVEENPYWMKTLRIVYQEMAGKGGLKHAFFDSWRDDKNYGLCSIDQFK